MGNVVGFGRHFLHMSDLRRRRFIWITVAAVMAMTAAIFLYAAFDPALSVFCPKCPFHLLTGLECPGCGSQRALHSLLNGDFAAAAHYNLLLVLSLPYFLLYLVLSVLPALFPATAGNCGKIKSVLYRGRALRIILAVIILFWILRNFTPAF